MALAQTELVLDRLRQAAPHLRFETTVIVTSGDRGSSSQIVDGIFVKEIQRSLLEGEIDLAIHSLKDMPTESPSGLMLGATPTREDPRDGLIGPNLRELPAAPRIGTGSPRRSAQVKRLRPDAQVSAIRGTVPTRISKVRSGDLHAVVLAVAGLKRLGLEADQVFGYDEALPAPGQGTLAVELREGESELHEIVGLIDDLSVRAAAAAERAVLRELGGGCLIPLGTHARVEEGALVLDASVISPDGRHEERVRRSGDVGAAEELGASAAAELRRMGALELIA